MTEPRNDEPGATEDPVRRLLGAAATPPPALPEHVSTRLDEILDGLVEERSGGAVTPSRLPSSGRDPGPAGVPDIEERRQRRWPGLLVAAAAVSVIGLGLGNVVGQQAGQEDASHGEAAGAGGATDEDGRETLLDGDTGRVAEDDVTEQSRVPRLRTDSLAVDVERVQHFAAPAPVPGSGPTRPCARPATRDGDSWLPVRLDGRPGVLVLRPQRDGTLRALVYTCDRPGTPAASTRVGAP